MVNDNIDPAQAENKVADLSLKLYNAVLPVLQAQGQAQLGIVATSLMWTYYQLFLHNAKTLGQDPKILYEELRNRADMAGDHVKAQVEEQTT